jgi:transposase
MLRYLLTTRKKTTIIAFKGPIDSFLLFFRRYLSLAMKLKRENSKQIPAKDYKDALKVVYMLSALITILPFISKNVTECFKNGLDLLRKVLENAKPVATEDNSDKPSGKSIGGRPGRELKEKSNGKPGGQPKHKGTTHLQSEKPDRIVELYPADKGKYENNPRYTELPTQTRQVTDIINLTEITNYILHGYLDTETQEKIYGKFPDGINAPFQYGDNLRATVIHYYSKGSLSFEKIAELINEQYGVNVSTATVCNIIREDVHGSPNLELFEEAAKKSLSESSTLNADETGISLKGKTNWVHVLVNGFFTLLHLHPKRGKEGVEAMGILQNFKNYVVHDCWAVYFKYGFIHCLCNAHISRELTKAIEMGQNWADEMKQHLLDLLALKEAYGGLLPQSIQIQARKKYRKILEEGFAATGGVVLARPPGQKKRGRIAKPFYRNLLERLRLYEDAILRFITDQAIPWSNNDAERPVRSLKVHMKISGCFRSEEFAQNYCKLRGYIESCRKNGISVSVAIRMLVKGEVPEFILNVLGNEEFKNAA